MTTKLTSLLLGAALLAVPATASAQYRFPRGAAGVAVQAQAAANAQATVDAKIAAAQAAAAERIRANTARMEGRIGAVASELQQTQQRAAQMETALKSEEYQAYLAAMRAAGGDINAAVQIRAQQLVKKKGEELAARTKWTTGYGVEPGAFNLAVYLQSNRKAAGPFGADNMTQFGLRGYFVNHAFRVHLSGGAQVNGVFQMPEGSICAFDAATNRYTKVRDCVLPNKDGFVESGAPTWSGVFGIGGSYSLGNILHGTLGYQIGLDSFAYTAAGEQQTTRETVPQHQFAVRVGTMAFGAPLAFAATIMPATYISPTGTRYSGTQVMLGFDLAPFIY